MFHHLLRFGVVAAGCIAATSAFASPNHTFSIGKTDFLVDGKPTVIRCGEMHFARIPREYWRHRLRMAHAMGLNTVCAYLFWNQIEPEQGRFNWKGMADAAAFCRMAQEEGLLVILRPGPYSCAEWDFGGFPWWLLRYPDIKVRTRDARYLAAVRDYLTEVGRVLAPLQVTKGGPIAMVQVENEYGSYGSDREYIGAVRDMLVQAGFNVPLFTCDGPSQLSNDVRDDIFCAVNFGGDPAGGFKALRAIRPTGPLICSEFYPGWFDSWGTRHHTGSTEGVVNDLEAMLKQRASFSIYMVHGGTSFGFSAGANCPPFSPQTTSYDYDAPISEAGWDTPKFHALRTLFSRYLNPGEKLPDMPARKSVIEIPAVTLNETAALVPTNARGRSNNTPLTFEALGQSLGCVVYRTVLPAGPAGRLVISDMHDYAIVSLDGKRVAVLDRRRGQSACKLPAREKTAQLDILVEAMGHVNYGGYIHDLKGITEKVEWEAGGVRTELTGWAMIKLPLNDAHVGSLSFGKSATEAPAFYRGSFALEKTGDTFLDMSTWGKGVVWVNGHNLGRYWNIGPHQTLYLPGPWLRKGKNEVVVLELLGAEKREVRGLNGPILDAPKAEPSVTHRKPGQSLDLSGSQPVVSGSFSDGPGWKEVRLAQPVAARYVCLEALSSQADDPYTSLAELAVLGADGKPLPNDDWKVVYADSEEVSSDANDAGNAIDGSPDSLWHTQWGSASPKHPHTIVVDLGHEQTIAGFSCLARSDGPNGRIKEYRFYASPKAFAGLW